MLRQFAFACVIGLACPVMSMAEPRAGIDLTAIDSAVPPQQDFWQFANGRWLAATSIPSDRSAWDTFSQLREATQMQLRNVIESVDPADATHPERRKLADLYAAFMDEAGVEKAGLGGAHDALPRIHGLRDYVDRYFPATNKARAEAMVANILAAYREAIATLDWMGPDTRREALAKLEAIAPRIAYPTNWRDYGGLEIRKDDLIGNVMRARRFDYDYWMSKVGTKVDRAEWRTTPQTVNAFYSASRNEIVFPAGILQPPFFDAGADDAVNYGGIGSVIGHEISHAFDDQGSRFDGNGNLRNWWTDDDRSRFDAKTRDLVAQYDAFTPLPGYHVNGALTLGENAADNAGLAIAIRAYGLARL